MVELIFFLARPSANRRFLSMSPFRRKAHVHREGREIIPLQKIVTVLPEDTFGISKILSDYRVKRRSIGHQSARWKLATITRRQLWKPKPQ